MIKIEQQFNAAFAKWKIRLPPNDIARRGRGKILEAGWAIWYLFGVDESGEYLDYYAAHRMTGDHHVRIYADGRKVGLPTISEYRLCSEDPEEDARLNEAYEAENQRVAELLESKGFGLEGDEPPGVQLNRFLRLKEVDEQK
jgi:hypothetical protein